MSSYIYAEIHEEFNKIDRWWIARAIIQRSVFCVDKTCYPKPGDLSAWWNIDIGSKYAYKA